MTNKRSLLKIMAIMMIFCIGSPPQVVKGGRGIDMSVDQQKQDLIIELGTIKIAEANLHQQLNKLDPRLKELNKKVDVLIAKNGDVVAILDEVEDIRNKYTYTGQELEALQERRYTIERILKT